ncbi:peptidylprolyl isomerase [Dapis sp. BLCC M126]|uniref:peptidylprolyl isomerase n=1 Tax=Dapis sp. BLCC M126 TaxID=3400189 RepID=UPI003CF94726
MRETLEKLQLPNISEATDEEIIGYLRRSCKLAAIAESAEEEALILGICQELDITISDEELQKAGDTFRQEHHLSEASKTIEWLEKQRITVENWSEGIKISLLAQKLKEHLFGEIVDTDYITNRNNYQRFALSQILVSNLTEAVEILRLLREENTSFCALALEYSKGKQSQENGGFAGVKFLVELLPEISQVVADGEEGNILGPIQTKLGYHILRIEKKFPVILSEVREQVIESLFQVWLHQKINSQENFS